MADATPMRADALRNREKLVKAARDAFAEHGLDTSLDEIAKRAGVGPGTLYRHFRCRDDLVAAVFLDQVAGYVERSERALLHPDPWVGFAEYTRDLCRTQAADRALADLLAQGHPNQELKALEARAYKNAEVLIGRAQASGALRADFSAEDLVLLSLAIAGIVRTMGTAAPRATNRFVALALDGFRADAATPAPAPISARTRQRALR